MLQTTNSPWFPSGSRSHRGCNHARSLWRRHLRPQDTRRHSASSERVQRIVLRTGSHGHAQRTRSAIVKPGGSQPENTPSFRLCTLLHTPPPARRKRLRGRCFTHRARASSRRLRATRAALPPPHRPGPHHRHGGDPSRPESVTTSRLRQLTRGPEADAASIAGFAPLTGSQAVVSRREYERISSLTGGGSVDSVESRL
jgi:hypothetical protein